MVTFYRYINTSNQMNIQVNNQTNLSNKYIRFIKWKIYQLKEKFHQLIYAEIFLKEEGKKPTMYVASIRLGIPGHDIIIKKQSADIWNLLLQSSKDAHRYLANHKSIRINGR